MNLFRPSRIAIQIPVVLVACLACVGTATAQIITNWAAYNDHRPSAAQVANGWAHTAPNVTGYDMGAPADTSGSLVDFRTGQTLPVTVTFTRVGTPNDFGTVTRPLPTNTPAAQIFYGICDLSNDGIVGVDTVVGTTNSVLITFNNLDPSKRYLFRGTGARNGGYAPRWTVATILADGWIDAHLNGSGPGVITSNNFPANLGAGQAAWNSGANAQGAVVGWDFIAPHPDGSFQITTEQYIGPTPGGGQALIDNYGYSFGAMLLAEVEVSAPVIRTNPPALTTLEQNRPFTLTVAATGTPLLYQWYKQGSGPITGATFPSYSVAQAALNDAGTYYAVVYNPLNRATSTLAQVVVNRDVTAPAVASIFSFPTLDGTGAATLDQIIVEFNEPVQASSVNSPSRYIVPGGGNPLAVVVTNGSTVVLQLATPLTPNTDYSVTLSGATDAVGNVAGSSTAPFHSWVPGVGNGVIFEAYHAGPGVEVDTLLASADYPENPFLRATLSTFDSRAIFPDNAQEQYGARMRGVFIPPVSGNWLFYMRTFDRGVVYLNPNGTDPAGKQEILRESTGNNPRNWDKFTSPAFFLRAGQAYYIEGLYKADTGTDVLKVAARLAGTGFPTPVDTPDTDVDTNSIAGGAIGFPLAPKDLGGALTILQNLADQTIEELNPATFSLVLSNPSLLPLQYQWFRDGSPITGANGPTYTIQPTIAADNGARFSVQVGKPGSVVTSRSALLTVVQDTHPPHIVDIISTPANLTNIVLRFNEMVQPAEANDFLNFELVGAGIGIPVASLGADGMTITLTTSDPLVLNTSYQLGVSSILDLSGLMITPSPTIVTFTAGVSGLPRITIEHSGPTAIISWPAPSTGFVLEQTDQFFSGATTWTLVTGQQIVVNGRITVTVDISTGTRFYRLRQ